MNRLIILIAFFSILFSCKNGDDTNNDPIKLIGTWRLIEQYSDPGDGSGDYVVVNSDKTITFLSDGTISSNGNLCSMNINTDENTIGTFDVSQSTITPEDCFSSNYSLNYELKENRLFIYYPCIEGCSQKFSKTN